MEVRQHRAEDRQTMRHLIECLHHPDSNGHSVNPGKIWSHPPSRWQVQTVPDIPLRWGPNWRSMLIGNPKVTWFRVYRSPGSDDCAVPMVIGTRLKEKLLGKFSKTTHEISLENTENLYN